MSSLSAVSENGVFGLGPKRRFFVAETGRFVRHMLWMQ
jgi:hypothetical protein